MAFGPSEVEPQAAKAAGRAAGRNKTAKSRSYKYASKSSSKSRRRGPIQYPPLRTASFIPATAAKTAPELKTAVEQRAAPVAVIRPASPLLTPSPSGKKGTLQKRLPTDSEVLDEAQDAYVRGERQHAIDLAMSVAEKNGETAERAWRFIGLAACSVRSHRLATRAYQHLRLPADLRSIENACRINGLFYRNEQFGDN